MKLNKRHSERGFSLLLVMALIGISTFFLSGALQWSSAGSGLTARHNDYYSAMAAAEAAPEKVIAEISKDFQSGGYAKVVSRQAYYQTLVPTSTESPDWANYEFTDADGSLNRTSVERVQDWQAGPLTWKYDGLNANAATYRITSNARLTGWGSHPTGTLREEIQVAEIPLFAFGVFYNLPLEVDSMQHDLSLTGHVHSNTNAYFGPALLNSLTFWGDVTSTGRILHQHYSSILLGLPLGAVIYKGKSDANVPSLNLPLGTNNTPDLWHEIIEIPPPSEPPESLLGQQRFYNKADLIILVSNSKVTARTGYANGFLSFSDAEYDAVIKPFVSTNAKLWDARQQKYVHLTDINVAELRQSATYNGVRARIGGRDPKIIYVADLRTFPNPATDAAAVRIIQAQILPTDVGLTLATMNPLYVKGNFNAPPSSLLSTNTQSTEPAALVCDALTVLSDNWDDAESLNNVPLLNSVPLRLASILGTTINGGIITGIVPTGGGVYSGGLENVFSLLENWSPSALTFNGSLAVLFPSEMATQPYRDAGLYYMPPLLRTIRFDTNFKQQNKLPHGTPQLRTLIRSVWSTTDTG